MVGKGEAWQTEDFVFEIQKRIEQSARACLPLSGDSRRSQEEKMKPAILTAIFRASMGIRCLSDGADTSFRRAC